jgi:hypothetical protein
MSCSGLRIARSSSVAASRPSEPALVATDGANTLGHGDRVGAA